MYESIKMNYKSYTLSSSVYNTSIIHSIIASPSSKWHNIGTAFKTNQVDLESKTDKRPPKWTNLFTPPVLPSITLHRDTNKHENQKPKLPPCVNIPLQPFVSPHGPV